VGQVADHISFSSDSKFHPIFHVSLLMKVIGSKFQNQNSLLELDEEASIKLQTQAILDQR